MYKIEKNAPYYSSLQFLRIMGHIPDSFERSHLRIFYMKFITVEIICFFGFIVMPLSLAVTSIKNKYGMDISESISIMTGTIGTTTTCSFFVSQYSKWSNFFVEISNFSKFTKPPNFDKLLKKLHIISRLTIWYCFGGSSIYAVAAYFETADCERLNKERGINLLCGSFTPIMPLPFDGNYFPVKMTIFFMQLGFSQFFLPTASIIVCIAFETTEIIVANCNNLKNLFHEAFESTTNEHIRSKLRFCIVCHIRILRLADQFNKLAKSTVAHFSLICAIIFGCIGNQIFNTKPVGAALFLIGYVIALFALCHAGQRIMDETSSIADAIYEAKWYNADIAIIKDVVFIMARCQKPVTLSALPLGILNYPLYVMIIKTSYTYLTLLHEST